ncbi:MAG: hypothetical protein COA99_15885 [Moraxellaceae bacterium]|nr:MAG: hypothetical protein COA99_15885 [Moraxellaceae bacterium]
MLMAETIVDQLRNIDFLSRISTGTLEVLATLCPLINLAEGDTLFQDGEAGSSMYVILSGELIVSRKGVEIARRQQGDYLGEMALIESMPRSATVKASRHASLLEITHEQFHSQLNASPDVLLAIMRTLSRRARENLGVLDRLEPQRGAELTPEVADKLEERAKYLMQEAGLTIREAEVAHLICEGFSDKLIAKRLDLSHHTVRDHLKKIYTKFEVNARTQLVSLIYK